MKEFLLSAGLILGKILTFFTTYISPVLKGVASLHVKEFYIVGFIVALIFGMLAFLAFRPWAAAIWFILAVICLNSYHNKDCKCLLEHEHDDDETN